MRRGPEDTIKISIGKFGSDPKEVTIPADSTVEDALEAAGISLSSTEKVWVNGERANANDILDDNDTVNIVTPKEAGSN